MSLLTRLIRFRSNQIHVVHETGFDVSAVDASEICGDFKEFIRVMLSRSGAKPEPEWIKGGKAGEIGAELRFRYEYSGMKGYETLRVKQWDRDPDTGAARLVWTQVETEPPLPVRNYSCTWTIAPEPGHPRRCRLKWTQSFDEPTLLGLISVASMVAKTFKRDGNGINAAFRRHYTRVFPSSERGLPKKTDRVLVVGAGPSGLHMAHLLRQRLGVKDITIVEKTGRIGGKTVSVPDRTNPDHGIVHELGTCYLHPAYFAVRELIGQLRAMPACDDPEFGREVAPVNYLVQSAGDVDRDLEGWVGSNLAKSTKWSPWAFTRLFYPKANTALALVTAKARYNRVHQKHFGDYNYSMRPQLTPESMTALDMSFGQFLESNGLSALLPILAYG
jgi:hypothetical protein